MVGGIVAALALTFALSRDSAESVVLREQVDRLQQALVDIEGQRGDFAQLTTRLEALESGAGAAIDEEISGQIGVLTERLAAIEAGADQGAASAQVADLAARVSELGAAVAEAQTSAGAGAASGERLAELEENLRDLATSLTQLQETTSGAAGSAEITELTSRIGALEGRVGQAEAAREEANGQIGAVEQRIAAGESQTAGLTEEVVALSGQVGGLSTRVDALTETVDQLREQVASSEDRRTRAAALALAVAQLDAAIETGAPFADLLDGLRALGADDPAVVAAVEQLAPAATSGGPGPAELKRSFDAIANEIVHAAQAPEGDGLLDQAAGNLMRLVTVRPVGADAEGDSAAARVARAEAALDQGDLAAAVAELETLDGTAAEAAGPWLADAKTRLQAQAALARLRERATLLLADG